MNRRSGMVSIALLYGAVLLDELVYGAQGAVLPQIKNDLQLSYTEIGLLFSLPGLVALFSDPLVGLLGDTRYRRILMLGGVLATTIGLFLTGISHSFLTLVLAFGILYVASGAYVNLAQATLIDRDVNHSEQVMARWTLLAYIAVSIAPLLVTVLALLGYGWRALYLGLAGIAAMFALLFLTLRLDDRPELRMQNPSAREFFDRLSAALQSRELLKWVILTLLAGLMVDQLLQVTGLYFDDVVGLGSAGASIAVAVFTIAGLAGNTILLPALNRYSGLRILRITALLAMTSYIGFLVAPAVWLKLALLALIGLLTASWYPILRAQCYQAIPGQSGLVLAVTSIDNVTSLLVPLLMGRIADAYGLQWAMWLLIVGPIALILGLLRARP